MYVICLPFLQISTERNSFIRVKKQTDINILQHAVIETKFPHIQVLGTVAVGRIKKGAMHNLLKSLGCYRLCVL